ncbi:hypothetical protein K438DRAFT_1859413, partial [Mycena galopus ATCC 62051]
MATIPALRRRIAELDAQIADHRRVLHDLEEARTAVERELHATPFPVLTLPAEITAEIFACCLLPFANLGWKGVIGEYRDIAPILLTQVCRAWRDVTLTTPRLWSTLVIIVDSVPAHAISNPHLIDDFIDRWFARAGQCPLSFVFRGKGVRADIAYQVLANVLRRYSHRFHYLELHNVDHLLHQLGLGSLNFPFLESASLNLDYPRDDALVNVFDNAPVLHEFHLHSARYRSTRLTLPWLQLTKYDGVVQDLEFFTLAPNLTEATCSGCIYRAESPLTHARLTSLTVKEGTY